MSSRFCKAALTVETESFRCCATSFRRIAIKKKLLIAEATAQ
jgi:hypothetical protein